ncbi:diguanylate cyclase [Solidesulfovibrio sp.]|uniref:GGDEF domain-containing protein n=1 Tax=Solidesulfovibrio sp. TaxID=2910990 RepID=UPI00262825A6|nr:diguanylate cyclase [Solidesulfovibrio sp.]
MDTPTTILLLAVGSFVICALLLVFQRHKDAAQRIPFLAPAKFLQGAGSLVLYLRGPFPDVLTVALGNTPLLLGCVCEFWAAAHLADRPVSRRAQLAMTACIVVACLAVCALPPVLRPVILFTGHAGLYLLPAWVLLRDNETGSLLRRTLGVSYALLGGLFLLYSLSRGFGDGGEPVLLGLPLEMLPGTGAYAMMLVGACSMLLLAKERDDDALERTRQSLSRTEAQYRQIVDTALEGILSLDAEDRVTYVNARMAALLGFAPEELLGKRIDAFIAPEHLPAHAAHMAVRRKGGDAVYEICGVRRDGEKLWGLVSSKSVMGADGTYQGAFVMFTDITTRKTMEAALEQSNRSLAVLTRTDGLTGIANRRHFDAALTLACARHDCQGAPLSLIMLDIDHFKAFNDLYGHVEGDACLRRVGETLTKTVVGRGCLVARYGGEEFACVLPRTDLAAARQAAQRIRLAVRALAIPHAGSAAGDRVTASLGVVTWAGTAPASPRDLVARADALLYRAKSSGRDCVVCLEIGETAAPARTDRETAD